ncbi:hypothetical protein DIURU_001919 [Diutina rugosa]|uniref:Major facilitator superfamily (MFS) profile domain-containing protein n=1 Tax=Diutina rugosa TaxID=5481 RepID=A0A642US28_DIURU|nr:uncharacterized protein DIURU_001919 [Diutina rugosa]KAA8904338.1 hypothetical protein DIURU_001919 [Diutina rugosa]
MAASVHSSSSQISIDSDPQLLLGPVDTESTQISGTPLKESKCTMVPRKQRRGLLGQFVILPEYSDARDYPNAFKSVIVFIVSLSAITGPMGVSIMMPALEDIVTELHTSTRVVNISVGTYVLSFGVFPMWWSLCSERYGRRTAFLISFSLFFGFSFGTALTPNIAGLIIFRILQGGCSASAQALGAGIIADLYVPQERGKAMGYYFLGPLCGPFLAPIIGGAVAQGWGWRATQWVLVIVSGFNTFLIMFFLPETLRQGEAPLASTQHDREVHDDGEVQDDVEPVADPYLQTLSRVSTGKSLYSLHVRNATSCMSTKGTTFSWWDPIYNMLVRPLHSLVLFRHPPVALVIGYSGIMFSVIFFINMTITYEYSRFPYNMSPIIIGLLYIPNSVAYILASMIGGRWNDHFLKKYAREHNGEIRPESRISWNVAIAVSMFPPACLIFGWCLDTKQHWVVPLVGTTLFGFASMIIMGTTATYLVDSLPGKGATGNAMNNLVRQCLAAVAIFVAEPALVGVGPGILFSILAGILFAANIFLLILKRKGDHFRDTSRLPKLYEKL